MIDFKGKDDKNAAEVQIGIRDGRHEKSHYLKLGKAFNCPAGTFTIVDIVPKTETVTVKGTNAKTERDAYYVILQKRDSQDKIEAHLKARVTEPEKKLFCASARSRKIRTKNFMPAIPSSWEAT
ncbi:MAG: hypothetical protein V8T87_12420 [Victivallales bacterium]